MVQWRKIELEVVLLLRKIELEVVLLLLLWTDDGSQ